MTHVLLLYLIFALAAQAPTTTLAPRKDQCKISGIVVKLGGSEPLRKAHVRIEDADERSRSISVSTDAAGHFELKDLDPGRYRLHVSRAGFVTEEYGQRKPSDPGAVLTLRSGQEISNMIFRMISAGVKAGRILDEDGEPMPSVIVNANRDLYTHGKRSLRISGWAETNDLGEYRLFGLAPGRYFVSAVSRADRTDDTGTDAEANAQGLARMYYPGKPDRFRATAILVKGGEEVPSVEILMQQVLTYHVRGRVFNQITHKPGVGSSVFLVSKMTDQEIFGEREANIGKSDGSFDFTDVPPGSYSLATFWFDEGRVYSSRTPVDVSNTNVENVGVTIMDGASVGGRVIWEGKPSLEKDELAVTLTPTDISFGYNSTRVSQLGLFTLKNVGEGSYYAAPSGQSKDCYVKDITYAGSSVLQEGFSVTAGAPGSLEIIISSQGARVRGEVSNQEGLPAAGVWVALVPNTARQSHHWLYKAQTTDQHGHFDVRGIAPGDYRLFSWDEVEEGAWEGPDFIKPLVDKNKGEKISVQERAEKSVTLLTIGTINAEEEKH